MHAPIVPRRLVGLAVVALLGLTALNSCATNKPEPSVEFEAEDVPEDADVPLIPEVSISGLPTRGSLRGPVTLVWFGDYLSKPSRATWEHVQQLRDSYPDDLRVAFRHQPADIDDRSGKAARAVIAAGEQGEYWAMHDRIFENQKKLSDSDSPDQLLESWARELELDVQQFNAVRTHPDSAGVIGRDWAVAGQLGVENVPNLFLNGARIRGTVPLEKLEARIDAEIDKTHKWLDQGVAAGLIYRKAVASNAPHGAPVLRGELGRKDLKDSPKIPVGDSPIIGPRDAPVTIVEFSDFECPYCQKVTDTLEKIRRNYPEQVRIVYKQYPLPMHKNARTATYAAMAAHQQGRFWEMHDKLFANQKQFESGNMKSLTARWADEMDLDVVQFKEDFDQQNRWDTLIDRHMELGNEIGVKGTPAFFVNGRALSGAQPYSKFESVIDSELDAVRELKDQGVDHADIYRRAVAKNLESTTDRADNEDSGPPEPEKDIRHAPVPDDAPVKGAQNDYLVTIVEFADFECPFCQKVKPSLEKLMKNYGDQVRLVYRHNPLSMHESADEAARAAMAAGEQDKFWEMHDKLFDNQDRLTENIDTYAKFAGQLGLDVDQFKKDYKSEAVKDRLARDQKAASDLEANGTPNFFINGIQVTGAHPYTKFENRVEQQIELAKRLRDEADDDLSGDALYKAAVETNKEEGVAEVEANDQEDEQDRVDPSKLKVGTAPVKGPMNAPVTIFEFSEFECPYCEKARNTLKEVLADYQGQVRLVHRDYPLPMHQNAKPAARAAWAAQQQGKFWPMYTLLFDNQAKLGEKGKFVELAKKIGLDVDNFKKDMNSEEALEQLEDDMSLGKKVGVKGTPAFFINGRRIVGAQPAEKFRKLIDKALEEAEADE